MVIFNVTSNGTTVRYLDITNLPLGTYTATTKLVQSIDLSKIISNFTVASSSGQSNIAVTKLVGVTTVRLHAASNATAAWEAGTYKADIKLVDVATGAVYYTPQYTVVVTSAIT